MCVCVCMRAGYQYTVLGGALVFTLRVRVVRGWRSRTGTAQQYTWLRGGCRLARQSACPKNNKGM